MRLLHALALWGIVMAEIATVAACSGGDTSIADPGRDDATAPAPTATTTPPDDAAGTATGDSSNEASAADAAPMDSGGADASTTDAALDGTAPATLVADIPGLTDFDFVGNDLVYRTPNFNHCTLPACADALALTGPTAMYAAGWTAGSDAKLHYISGFGGGTSLTHYSVGFDNAGAVSQAVNFGGDFVFFSSLHGGDVGRAFFCVVPGSNMGRYRFQISFLTTLANTSRVARASILSVAPPSPPAPLSAGLVHSNVGAAVIYTPRQQPSLPPAAPVAATLTGVSAPVPATAPTLLAVSAMGATVTHPVVFVVRAGDLEACPLATSCAAWTSLGALGSVLLPDGLHLYVGTATGLARCKLEEISTAGTCTLATVGPAEPVSAPLYLTATDAWYRSGTKIRRVPK